MEDSLDMEMKPQSKSLVQGGDMELQTIGFEDVGDLDDLAKESETMDPEDMERKAKALAQKKKLEAEQKKKDDMIKAQKLVQLSKMQAEEAEKKRKAAIKPPTPEQIKAKKELAKRSADEKEEDDLEKDMI